MEAVRVGGVTVVARPAQLWLGIALAREADRRTEWPGLGTVALDSLRLIALANGAALDSLTSGRAPAWGAAIALPQ